MVAKVSLIQDFAAKTTIMRDLYGIVQKVDRGDKLGACNDMLAKAKSVQVMVMYNDAFWMAIKEYMGRVLEGHVQGFVDKYQKFKRGAGKAQELQPGSSSADFQNTLNMLESIKAKVERLDVRPSSPIPSSGESSGMSGMPHGYGMMGMHGMHGDRGGAAAGQYASDELRALEKQLKKVMPASSTLAGDLAKRRGDLKDSASPHRVGVVSDTVADYMAPFFDEAESRIKEEKDLADGRDTDAFDPRRLSEDDFISYHSSSQSFRTWAEKEGAFLTPDELEVFDKTVSYNSIAQKPLQGYLALCADIVKKIDAKVKSLSSKEDHLKRDLQSVATAIAAFQNGALSAMASGRKPDAIDQLDSALRRSLPSGLLGDLDVKPGTRSSAAHDGASAAGFTGNGSAELAGSAAAGSLAGFMFRRVDKQRVFKHVAQFESFKQAVGDDKIVDRIGNAVQRLRERVADLQAKLGPSVQQANTVMTTEALPNAKTAALLAFLKSVRREVNQYVHHHVAFVVNRHRDAQAYMNYWIGMKELVPDPDVLQKLESYSNDRKALVADVRKTFDDLRSHVLDAYRSSGTSSATDNIALTDEQTVEVEERYQDTVEWTRDKEERLSQLHLSESPPLIETLLEPQFVTIYILKLLRVVVGWCALRVASNVFQTMYEDRVYVRDTSPPHPAVFVGLFLGVDLAMNVVIFAILLFLKHIFKASDNTFPVDRQMLGAWGLDYAISTALVGLIALVIGEVIRRKKYFRYKYEGDRGIRAMQQMVMYVYCVMLFMPFFRVAHG
jgi:hypothetical protein